MLQLLRESYTEQRDCHNGVLYHKFPQLNVSRNILGASLLFDLAAKRLRIRYNTHAGLQG